MFARIVYRVMSWWYRSKLEREQPVLRTLRLAKKRRQKAHGKTSDIEASQREILHRAIGWRGTR